MRIYDSQDTNKLIEVKCNKCGKDIKVQNGIVIEGVFSVDYVWEFFSEKDGQIDSFDICEECYDYVKKQFAIPIDTKDKTELI